MKKDHEGIVETIPPNDPQQILKPQTAFTMRQMMRRVVLKGTGTGAALDGYSAAGKTGSAQIYDFDRRVYTHKYNASFMGFAPVTNPAIVVVVTLNGSSKFGGLVAAPVFRTVASAALRHLGVPKDLPDEEPLPSVSEDLNDLAIASVSAPEQPEIPSMLVGPEPSPAAEEPPKYAGRRVPDFQGLTLRDVVETSSAAGVPVDLIGRGVARVQTPPPGTVLVPGERVRVQFAR